MTERAATAPAAEAARERGGISLQARLLLVSANADRGGPAAGRFYSRGAAAEESQDYDRAKGGEKNVSHNGVGFLLNRKTRLQ
jgi:hypothetical protein